MKIGIKTGFLKSCSLRQSLQVYELRNRVTTFVFQGGNANMIDIETILKLLTAGILLAKAILDISQQKKQ